MFVLVPEDQSDFIFANFGHNIPKVLPNTSDWDAQIRGKVCELLRVQFKVDNMVMGSSSPFLGFEQNQTCLLSILTAMGSHSDQNACIHATREMIVFALSSRRRRWVTFLLSQVYL